MRYDSSHWDNLKSMYDSWGLPINQDDLPSIGFINENAACFLITTNCRSCFLEFLISRKGNYFRDVEEVMDCCLKEAKELGFKIAFGISSSKSGIKRAIKHGFKISDTKVILRREI